ncbi:extracellular solute-binding protein [Natronosporangium hydrolyticum]|uniref:Extracellular solute-binding protein n=1 Tax=Natronosporangium hydrolyticum TaxID=2811111 RepID=A0A895YMQ2_9ACTN|nr:extracellular solute-binding protein [Natronosporangium hydrolyticum]QSB17245.1 extracellular solute-binding protein [Natronosporangium hydrolyticum]
MSRPLNRRNFLRLSALGAGAAAAGPVLSGCGNGGSSSSDSGDDTIVYAVQAFAHDAIRPIIDEFTAETGITVELEGGPASGQDLLTQLVPAFNSGTTPYDVVDVDDPAGAAMVAGGWLEPLDDALPDELADDLTDGMAEGTATWNTVDGNIMRVYHNWELGYHWLRSDVLADLDLAAPTSWDELITIGEEVKQQTGMYALGDAASKPGLTFVYLAYLAAQSGGDLYAFDSRIEEAFAFARELIDRELFPRDALTWTYDQLNSSYMQDNLLSMRQWTFFDGVAADNTDWYAEEKVLITPPPAGPGGALTWAGGWGYAIPTASTKKEQAKQFVRFMSGNEVAVRLAEASSFFISARTSVLDALGDSGIVAAMREYSEGGHVAPRPFHPQAARAETIIDDIGQAYLAGQMDLDEAMSEGAARIDDLS